MVSCVDRSIVVLRVVKLSLKWRVLRAKGGQTMLKVILATTMAVAVAGCAANGDALKSGSDAVAAVTAPDQALLEAITAQDHAQVLALLNAGADPNAQGATGYRATALMRAVSKQDAKLVEELLRRGAKIDAPDAYGDPAINYAAYYGYADMIRLLMDNGARADIVGHGDALDITLRFGREAQTQMIAPDDYLAPLLEAAKGGHAQAVASLLAQGHDLAATDRSGRSALHLAALSGSVEAARALIAADVEIDARDRIGFTPLTIAAREGHRKLADLLIENGADVNAVALRRGLAMRPHFMAAIGGHIDVLSMLIEAGADVNAGDADGNPAIGWAIGEEQPEAALYLLHNGTDPEKHAAFFAQAAEFAESLGYAKLAGEIRAAQR